ncbi:MAG TPA: hypothetical protein VKT81_01465 [Bryobacteraceae bacterium]|nr:hypothetical protein [Bryobacteraceae bacterium]
MLRRIALVLASVLYIGAGILHFTKTPVYLRIVPPYIPWHLAMVEISGVCEILGGLGLLIRFTRRAAAWGLVALLIAVFPANIYMVAHPAAAGAASIPPVLLWVRLPLQLVLIAWVLWVKGSSKQHGAPA